MNRTHSAYILKASISLAALCMQTRNPAKDLPIGIVGSLLACSALYAGLALTLCLMVRALTMPASQTAMLSASVSLDSSLSVCAAACHRKTLAVIKI